MIASLESIAVHRLFNLVNDIPRNDGFRIDTLSSVQLQLMVENACHILQLAEMEEHFRFHSGNELSSVVPYITKSYYNLLPPSIREDISPDKIRNIGFQFTIQHAILNQIVPSVFDISLPSYIDKLCYFGSKYIESLVIRVNLQQFCNRYPGALQCISKLDNLKIINFAGCDGSLSMVHALIGLLRVSSVIEKIHLQNNQMNSHDMKILSSAIISSKSKNSLKSIELQWNQIGDEGLMATALIIKNCKNLQYVDITHCGGSQKGRELCIKASKDVKLKNLKLL